MTSIIHSLLGDQVEFFIPEGGIHLWCKINEPFNETKLVEEALKRGVAFTPGSILGSKKGYVRFTFARAEVSEIREGIRRFKDALICLNNKG